MSIDRSIRPPAAVWPLALGGLGFVCGFFGPIVLAPDANQGPLLGLFITGPGGVALGIAIAAAVRVLRVPAVRQWQVLGAIAALLALATLAFATPQPRYLGRLVDAEVVACDAPHAAADAAVSRWEQRFTEVTWAKPRADWRERLARSLADEPGAIVVLRVLRERALYENRKPWNAGTLAARDWKHAGEEHSFWTADVDCARWLATPRQLYVPTSASDAGWPPARLANFLGLEELGPVPATFAPYAEP